MISVWNKESGELLFENPVLIIEQKYQFSKLCASVKRILLNKQNKAFSDDYLTLSFINLDLSLNDTFSSKIKSFFSGTSPSTLKMVRCLFTTPYLIVYKLLRHPKENNKFFVFYDEHFTLFESSDDLYVSNKW